MASQILKYLLLKFHPQVGITETVVLKITESFGVLIVLWISFLQRDEK